MKVLIIEDDIILGASLKDYVESEGMQADLVSDDRGVDKFFNFDYYDVILLDLMLRVKKGEWLLSAIKAENYGIPVIVITAKDQIESKEECFGKGADDYIVKPFDPKELILRIKSVIKRYGCSENMYMIGGVCIDVIKKFFL